MAGRMVYLGLGSNMGDRLVNLKRAVSFIASKINVTAVSGIYESKSVGYEEEAPDYLNMAIAAETTLPLPNLLILAKGVETALGRRPAPPNAPRPIDVDILLAEKEKIDSPELCVPHKKMHSRAFVLLPLNELCPNCIHPYLYKTVEELLGELEDENAEYWGELDMAF